MGFSGGGTERKKMQTEGESDVKACVTSDLCRSKTAVLTDRRIRIMNEVVSGIRIIKMYAWEKPVSALVSEARR